MFVLHDTFSRRSESRHTTERLLEDGGRCLDLTHSKMRELFFGSRSRPQASGKDSVSGTEGRLRVQSNWIAKTNRVPFFSAIAAIVAALSLTSCGGFFPAADQIVTLQVSPASAAILPNATQQFTATATFGNNTTGDVTSQVTWLSSSSGIATITSSGLATGVAPGNATITAKSNNSSVTATALMTVSNHTVTGLTVSPSSTTISLSAGQTAQFAAALTFSDGTAQDVTTSATWTSSVPSVASVNSTGTASPISIGTTTITAAAGGTAGSASLSVTQ